MFMFRTLLLTITFYLASSCYVEASFRSLDTLSCKDCKKFLSSCPSSKLRTSLDLDTELANLILLSILNDPEMKRISPEDAEEIRQCDFRNRQWRLNLEKSSICYRIHSNETAGYSDEDKVALTIDLMRKVVQLNDITTIINKQQRPVAGLPLGDWNVKAIIKLFLAPQTIQPSEGTWLLSKLAQFEYPLGYSLEDRIGRLEKFGRLQTEYIPKLRVWNIAIRPILSDGTRLQLPSDHPSIRLTTLKKTHEPPYVSIATAHSYEILARFPKEIIHMICAYLMSMDLISFAGVNKHLQEASIGPINQRLNRIRDNIIQQGFHAPNTFKFHGPRKNEKCPSALEILINRAKALDAVEFLYDAATDTLNKARNTSSEPYSNEEGLSTPGTLSANKSYDLPLDEEK